MNRRVKVITHLYRAARRLSDIHSLRSPSAFARHRVRKVVLENVFKILRKIGL